MSAGPEVKSPLRPLPRPANKIKHEDIPPHMIRTSQTHPIRIDVLPVAAGELGLTLCPGKHGDSLTGDPWARDLDIDLAAIRAWGASLILTLMERQEFDCLNVSDLSKRVAAHGMGWLHMPIPDQDIPGPDFEGPWSTRRVVILARLQAGDKILVHCRGGLGRTGLVAAMILIETGAVPEAAVTAVRKVRPGAIETRRQEEFVLQYRPVPEGGTLPGIHWKSCV